MDKENNYRTLCNHWKTTTTTTTKTSNGVIPPCTVPYLASSFNNVLGMIFHISTCSHSSKWLHSIPLYGYSMIYVINPLSTKWNISFTYMIGYISILSLFQVIPHIILSIKLHSLFPPEVASGTLHSWISV